MNRVARPLAWAATVVNTRLNLPLRQEQPSFPPSSRRSRIAGMDVQQPTAYTIACIRSDGTGVRVIGEMTLAEAQDIAQMLRDSGGYVDVRIKVVIPGQSAEASPN
jgi:hypothetical protein